MHDKCCQDFQKTVDKYLIRHRSVLDILSKHQETTARVNRAFAKAVTECGCVKINAGRQQIPPEANYSDLHKYMSSHLSGELCSSCKEILAKELGHSLFYYTAICNLAGLDLKDIVTEEQKRVNTLGFFHLS
jgi:hypothetical protein